MSKHKLEVVFSENEIPVKQLATTLSTLSLLKNFKADLGAKGLLSRIHFNTTYGVFEIRYVVVESCDISILFISTPIQDINFAKDVVDLFVNESSFLQARYYDYEYDYWQNAEDLLLYENSHIDVSTLPKKDNGFPFPLNDIIVDISNNPGRRIFRENYIEFVGIITWASKLLVERTGIKTKYPALNQDMFKVSIINNNAAMIELVNSDILSDSFNALRKALYGVHADALEIKKPWWKIW